MNYSSPIKINTTQITFLDYRYQNSEYAIFAALFMVVCIVLGIFVLAPMFPPLGQASATPESIAAFYREHNLSKRIGLCVMMLGTPFLIPAFALMGEIIKRSMNMPIVGSVQYACGLFGILFTFMMTICWGTAAFRPERAPEITQMLHDLGWLFATWVAPATMLQILCICIAVFKDSSDQPLFARWFGYVNLWMFILAIPACVINIFNTGPFAYDGLLGFWLPYAALFAWGGALFIGLWQAIRKLQGGSGQ